MADTPEYETDASAEAAGIPGGHKDTTWMIENGYPDEAIEADLMALTDDRLYEITRLCPETSYAPEECIPCTAHVLLSERIEAAKNAPMPDVGVIEIEEGEVIPELLELAQRVQQEDRPVEQRFAEQVNTLMHLVEEMLTGPPIPPREVSMEELAALVVGAEKWVQMMDAQGMELAPNQEAIKERIKAVIMKIRRDG